MDQEFGTFLLDRQKNLPPGVVCRRTGSALSPSAHPRCVLILIDAVSHLDCRAAWAS
jgi:hypothetical protein